MRIAHPDRAIVTFLIKSVVPKQQPFNSISTLSSKSMASDEAPISDDEQYGFRRPEMYQSSLAGTVGTHGRHLFLCHKTAADWPSHIERSDADPLPRLFAAALKSRKDDIAVKTNLTICEEREGTEFSDGDVLIFPEMIKYRSLKESDVDSFVQDVVVNGSLWELGDPEELTGSFVFVCSHNSRDRRCGVCGPVLIEKFNEEIGSRGIGDNVAVSGCSHIGGHKYAGNLIIYSPGPDGKITGHWYGYVTPDDVPELLDQHIAKGEVIQRIWRGQMGVTPEEGEKDNQEKLPNGNKEGEKAKEEKLPNGNKESENKQEESSSQDKKESFTSCCQGDANGAGFTCCRDPSFEEKGKIEDKNPDACSEKGGSVCKLKSWVGSFEQRDVLTAAAVVGAVATVAVAYSCYRRSH